MDALLIVDVQNDFCPGGSLAVQRGDEIIPVINSIIDSFDVVVASLDWHPADHVCFVTRHKTKKVGDTVYFGDVPQIIWPEHCIQNTKGAEFHPKLKTGSITKTIKKGMNPHLDSYSAFRDNHKKYITELNHYLKDMSVDRVFIVGLAADYCVKFTAIDAHELDYEVTVIEDAVRGVNINKGDEEKALEELKELGIRVMDSNEI